MKWKIGKHRNDPPGKLAPIHNLGKGDPLERVKCSKRAYYGFLRFVNQLAYLLKQCMSGFFVSNRKGFWELRITNYKL
jgi:hypothetical protein